VPEIAFPYRVGVLVELVLAVEDAGEGMFTTKVTKNTK